MIEIEFNDDKLTGAILRIETALSDLAPLMRDIGELMVGSTKQRFIAGTAPDGTTWAPKSEVTKRVYERRGDRVDDRPLFGPSGSLSGNIHYQADSSSVSWGSVLIYAAMMQFGGAKEQFPHLWGDIPARPFLGLSTEDRDLIAEEVEEWMSGLMTS